MCCWSCDLPALPAVRPCLHSCVQRGGWNAAPTAERQEENNHLSHRVDDCLSRNGLLLRGHRARDDQYQLTLVSGKTSTSIVMWKNVTFSIFTGGLNTWTLWDLTMKPRTDFHPKTHTYTPWLTTTIYTFTYKLQWIHELFNDQNDFGNTP